MIIGICGYGYSGSGAVLDLLKGYEEMQVLDSFEFSFVYKPDGIEDLERAIVTAPSRYFSSDSAIRRFIQFMTRMKKNFNVATKGAFEAQLKKYLDSIIQTTWMGSTSVHMYQESFLSYIFRQRIARSFRSKYERIFGGIGCSFLPDKAMYYSYMSDDFYEATKKFISEFIAEMYVGSKGMIVLDQPFAANDPEKSFRFFDHPKAIVVKRDPRDVYLLAKTSVGMSARFIPTDDVESFIVYYRGMMNSRKMDNPNILELCFEDLIYQYDVSIRHIEGFLSLDSEIRTRNTRFDPTKSINNTQLYLKYPKFSVMINRIVESLPEYLYDFSQFERKPSFNTSSF